MISDRIQGRRFRKPPQIVLDLYRTMVRIRMCEESLVEPISRGEIRTPCHLYSGEEAVAAGVCAALNKRDYVFSTHRSHGHFLAKGGDMKALLAEIYGKETGCSRGRGGSMHLVDVENGMLGSAPIVAGTISLAVGAALASRVRKDHRVTACFFGDGATGEGVLYESMNFASLKKLPLIFVCENNLYSTHLPIRECRPSVPIFKIGRPFAIKSRRIDGNDVFKVYSAAVEAVRDCRSGDGPVFLEYLTYRQRGHVGPNDNLQGTGTDIRPKEEIRRWRKKDPIARCERFLLNECAMDEDLLAEIGQRAKDEVVRAHRFVGESPFPRRGDLAANVFKE